MASLSLAIAMAVLAHHDPAASSIVDQSDVSAFCLMVEPTGAVNSSAASTAWMDQFLAAADLMEIIGARTQPEAKAELVAWCVQHKKSSARIAVNNPP